MFASSAKTAKTQSACKNLHDSMGRHVSAAVATLNQYQPGQDWNLVQVETLEKSFKGIYSDLQNMMNESESEVATSIAKNCSMMVIAATDMREKQETHTWESLISNVDHVYPVVSRSLHNRVTVTSDEEDKHALTEAVETLDRETPLMRSTCQAFRNHQASDMQKNSHCNAIIYAMQRASDVLAKHIIGDASYKHHGIEPEAFNETLDDLINSINRGDGSGIRSAAQDLTDRIKDMERRKALENASQALKEQTKDLLAASKDALKNKDSEDAKARLNNLVAGMKSQVADLAAQEEAAARRKAELLRQAGGLGRAVDNMANAANSFKAGHVAPTLNQAEIDRQEREKDEKLAAKQAEQNRHVAPPPKAAPARTNDAELDDLLEGLNNL